MYLLFRDPSDLTTVLWPVLFLQKKSSKVNNLTLPSFWNVPGPVKHFFTYQADFRYRNACKLWAGQGSNIEEKRTPSLFIYLDAECWAQHPPAGQRAWADQKLFGRRGPGSCTCTRTLTAELSQPQQVRKLEQAKSSKGEEGQVHVSVPGLWLLSSASPSRSESLSWSEALEEDMARLLYVYLDSECWAQPAPAGQKTWADQKL